MPMHTFLLVAATVASPFGPAVLQPSTPIASACAMKTFQDTKCTLNAYAKTSEPTVSACCSLCSSDSRCMQFTFHTNRTENNCDRVATAVKQPLPGSICGIKAAPPSPAPPPPPPPTPPPSPAPPPSPPWAVLPTWLKLLTTNVTAEIEFAVRNFQLLQAATHEEGSVEQNEIDVCKLVKNVDAAKPCLFYWNTEKMLNSTLTAQYMIRHKPEWLLKDDRGNYAHAKGSMFVPDYRIQAAGAYYLSACRNATLSGVVDGCVLDSATNFNEADTAMLTSEYAFTKEEQASYVDGKRGALQHLQDTVPGTPLYAHCSTCLSAGKTCAGIRGQMTQKFDVSMEWVEILELMAAQGKQFMVYNDGQNGLDCENEDDRGAMLGTFLVGAGNSTYFNCGPNCANANVYSDYSKHLGVPLDSKAVRYSAGIGTPDSSVSTPGGISVRSKLLPGLIVRRFSSGTVAKFRPGSSSTVRGEACVEWADGTVSGTCPTLHT